MGAGHRVLVVLALVALALGGCSRNAATFQGDFTAAEPPPAGQARVYFLRPLFASALAADAPTVNIDGRDAFNLPHGSYASVVLGPGRHGLLLRPTLTDSPLWSADLRFDLQPGAIHYVAIWYDADKTWSAQRTTVHLPGTLIFVPVVTAGDRVVPTRARVEVVSEDDARLVLPELRKVEVPVAR
jgi:hypothetical protein